MIYNILRRNILALIAIMYITCDILLGSLPVLAHVIPNGISHDTLFAIRDNHLVVDYSIFMYYTDLQPFYETVDINKDGSIDDNESQNFIKKIQPQFYCLSQGQWYQPQKILHFPKYTELDTSGVYPTIVFTIDLGMSQLTKEAIDFSCVNEFRISSVDPQYWHLTLPPEHIDLTQVEAPDLTHVKGKWADPNTESHATNGSNPTTNFPYVIVGGVILILGGFIFLRIRTKKEP